MTQDVSLTLSGVHLPGGEDPLGIWELGSSRTVAFAASPAFDGLAWRVDVPEPSWQVRANLRAQREAVGARDRQLDAIGMRVSRLDFVPRYSMAARAYATPEARETLGPPEAELLEAVAALSGAMPGTQAMAFDTRTAGQVDFRELYAQCQALLVQFQALVRPVARVETVVGARTVGLTSIDWQGDHQTAWPDGVTPAEMQVHLDAVRLALASRQTLLRLFVVVVTGALGLALKAHIPGGQILLLPAVYRFVRDVLEELERLSAA